MKGLNVKKSTALYTGILLILIAGFVFAMPFCDESGKSSVSQSAVPNTLEFVVEPGNQTVDDASYYFLPPSLSPTLASRCLFREPVPLYLVVGGEGKEFVSIPENTTLYLNVVHIPVTVKIPVDYNGSVNIPFYIRAFQDPQIPGCTMKHGVDLEQPFMVCPGSSVSGSIDVFVLRKNAVIHTNSLDKTIVEPEVVPLQKIQVLNEDPTPVKESAADYTLLIAVGVLAFVGVGFFVLRKRREKLENQFND